MKVNNNYIYFSLFAWLLGGLALVVSQPGGEPSGFEIFGFLCFLTFFLYVIDMMVMFKGLLKELAWFLGYAISIIVLAYVVQVFWPVESKEFLRSWHQKSVIAFLGTAGLLPAIICNASEQLLEVKIGSANYLRHYPFTIGFWLLYLQLFITIKIWEPVCTRQPYPCFFLLLIYNFLFGLALIAIMLKLFGFILVGLSLITWGYLYFPRLGIPTVSSSRRKQREIRKAGEDIDRAQQRLAKVLNEIDNI